MAFTVDTRTQTEYGLVRTFGQADMQFSTLAGSTLGSANNAASAVKAMTAMVCQR